MFYNKAFSSFKNVLRGNALGKSKNNVWSILEQGEYIWAGTDSELLKINKSTFEVEKISIDNITNAKLLKSRDLVLFEENLLIATEGNGVILYNTKSKTKNSLLPKTVIY
jgi:hypothetical protein